MDDLRIIRLEKAKAIELLTTTLPPDTGDFFHGFDCLVALVRNAYAIRAYQTNLSTAINEFKSHEEENPLLKFAWGDFSPENDHQWSIQRCAEEKTKIMQVLVDTPTAANTSFAHLMQSKTMRETFFAHETFRLLSGVWEFKGSEQTYTQPRTLELFSWTSKSDDDSLQKLIDARFTAENSADGSVHTIPFANPPALVRVVYHSKQPLPCPRRDLMKFYMPVGRFVEMEDGSVSHHPRHASKRYELVAAVHIPARGAGGVSVQSWDRLAQRNKVTTRSSAATTPWSFEDEQRCSYVLLYAQIDDDNLPF